jgi:hypothetical protein
MKRITIPELNALSIRKLGLDSASLDLSSVEALAGALRRAAGFLCPCVSSELLEQVVESIEGVAEDPTELRELADETLEALVAYGDLVECSILAAGQTKGVDMLYLSPPSFVCRQDGSAFLVGISSEGLFPLPDDYVMRIEHDGHVRRIAPAPGEELRSLLSQFGLFEISMPQWLRIPAVASAEQYVLRFNELLSVAPAAGSIPDLRILDPSKPVRYYPGRWTDSGRRTGRFVARRPQAYGAELWCYVELENGNTGKLLDLPQIEKRWRASDEAWRLQAAIDAGNSKHQNYRLRPGPTKAEVVLDLFSPVPLWAQRRWDLTGRPVPRSGCLFSYVLPVKAVEEEISFLKSMLWLIDYREAR